VNTDFTLSARVRAEAKKFLERNGGKLEQPVSLVFFADSGTTMQGPSQDGNALIAALDKSDAALRTVNRTQGVYGAIDRFEMSLNALMSLATFEGHKPGRKMLIWVSPGWPILSGPNVRLTTKEREGIFNSAVAASTALRQALIALYIVDPIGVAEAGSIRTTYYKEFLKGLSSARNAEPGNLSLQVLAQQSGGRVYNSSNDVATDIANSVRDIDAWYVLSFDSPPADGPNEYHALDVKLGQKGLTAQTRAGYYAQP
jgi:VWFA-related protein